MEEENVPIVDAAPVVVPENASATAAEITATETITPSTSVPSKKKGKKSKSMGSVEATPTAAMNEPEIEPVSVEPAVTAVVENKTPLRRKSNRLSSSSIVDDTKKSAKKSTVKKSSPNPAPASKEVDGPEERRMSNRRSLNTAKEEEKPKPAVEGKQRKSLEAKRKSLGTAMAEVQAVTVELDRMKMMQAERAEKRKKSKLATVAQRPLEISKLAPSHIAATRPTKPAIDYKKAHAKMFANFPTLADYAAKRNLVVGDATPAKAAAPVSATKAAPVSAKGASSSTKPAGRPAMGLFSPATTVRVRTPLVKQTKPFIVEKSTKPLTTITEFRLATDTRALEKATKTPATTSKSVSLTKPSTIKKTVSTSSKENESVDANVAPVTVSSSTDAAKKSFDIKESLKKPITWKPYTKKYEYTDPLKPVVPVVPIIQRHKLYKPTIDLDRKKDNRVNVFLNKGKERREANMMKARGLAL
jgi:hypothetical protein